MNWNSAAWRKSTGSDTGACVEVAFAEGVIGVRDTKAAGKGPVLEVTEEEWRAFGAGAQGHEFDFDHLASGK